MGVLFHTDWDVGTLSGGTYTQATPELPNSHTWAFTNSAFIAAGGTPWGGNSYADVGDTYGAKVACTVSSATIPNTSSTGFRIRVAASVSNANGGNILQFGSAAPPDELDIRITSGGNLATAYAYNSTNAQNIDFGFNGGGTPTRDETPFYMEVIFDPSNSTPGDRFRARWWYVDGGSAGAFYSDGTDFTPETREQFVTCYFGDYDNNADQLRVGSIVISDDISQDLSTWTPSAGGLLLPSPRSTQRNTLLRI